MQSSVLTRGTGAQSSQSPSQHSLQAAEAETLSSSSAHLAERGARRHWQTRAADLASTLGWLSIGLGLAGLLMPRTISRAAGVPPQNNLLRGIGVRELISGAGILMRPEKPGWLWSRVAGDAMDLSLIALAGRRQTPLSGAMRAALAGITVLDLLAAYDTTMRVRSKRWRSPRAASGAGASGMAHVKKTLDVNHSPETCYRFWRDMENFPRFMQHVESVESIDATRSRWQVRGPFRQHISWEAELTSDVPGQQLGWRTVAGSDVAHTGVVRFSPGPARRGTRIEVDFQFHAPMGKTGLMLTRVMGEDPAQQVSDDLRRFKQLVETGEIPTTIGQPAGQRSALGRLVHKGGPG